MVGKLGRGQILWVFLAMFVLGRIAEWAPVPAGFGAGLIGWLVATKWSE